MFNFYGAFYCSDTTSDTEKESLINDSLFLILLYYHVVECLTSFQRLQNLYEPRLERMHVCI